MYPPRPFCRRDPTVAFSAFDTAGRTPLHPPRPFRRRDHEFTLSAFDTAGRNTPLSRGFQPEFVSGGNYQRPRRIKSLHLRRRLKPTEEPTQAYNCVLPPKTTNVIPVAPVISVDVIAPITPPRFWRSSHSPSPDDLEFLRQIEELEHNCTESEDFFDEVLKLMDIFLCVKCGILLVSV